MVKARRRRNKITQIKSSNNKWISDHQDIEYHFLEHYKSLFSDPQPLSMEEIQNQILNIPIPTLTPQQINMLDQPIQVDEISLAVNQLGPLKTPGPDRVLAAFYQKYWNIVKLDIINIVKAFFHLGFLLKSLNHTFITLIPKPNTPELVFQFDKLFFVMSLTKLFPWLWSIG